MPVEPGGEGLFEPHDPGRFSRDLAEAINSILNSPERMREMGEKARERIEQKFSWEDIAHQTLEFYKETADASVCSDTIR